MMPVPMIKATARVNCITTITVRRENPLIKEALPDLNILVGAKDESAKAG